MPVTSARRVVAAAAIAIFAMTTLVACASGVSSATATKDAIGREAGAYRASHLCVLNGTDKTILSVGEFEMTRTGETHPDPTGSLKSGATWCTNGYNAFTDNFETTMDASVEIKFAESGGDFARFAVSNPGNGYPFIQFGQQTWDWLFYPGRNYDPWEIDTTIPDPEDSYSKTGPAHDYHIRRLDDTPNFKEWLVTVKS
jgi:hypothetical protein